MEKKCISILGCGWLGLPLAKQLLKEGYEVKGSTTHEHKIEEMQNAGIEPYVVSISDTCMYVSNKEFFNSEILFINFPPRRIENIESYYPMQIKQLLGYIRPMPIEKILFAGSTSVYPNTGEMVDETCTQPASKASGKALQEAEALIMKAYPASTIIRFGGLIGADRNPGRFLSGKKELKNGNVPVNLIHQDDCIGIISNILQMNVEGECFNAVMPEHPTRKEFYTKAAVAGGYEIPEFVDGKSTDFKIVNGTYAIEKLNYFFKYKSPLDVV